MNIQAISEFLDLVKNPDKYTEYLKNIQTQQSQLEAAIERVGKVNEIDGLKQKAEKLVNIAQTKADKILLDAESAIAKRQEAFDSEFEKLRKKEEAANAKLQDATAKLEQALALNTETQNRQKLLTISEKQYAEDSAKLSALIAEYEEKVAKLRSVMV